MVSYTLESTQSLCPPPLKKPKYYWGEPHTTEFYAFLGICIYIYIYVSVQPLTKCTCVKCFMSKMASMLRPLRVCNRQKEKGSEIDASPQLPTSVGVQSLNRSRLPRSVLLDRSRSPNIYHGGSRVLMHAYATRGLGFLVCCATISRQLASLHDKS